MINIYDYVVFQKCGVALTVCSDVEKKDDRSPQVSTVTKHTHTLFQI